LDELAASFKLSNCVKREGLNEILRKDAQTARYFRALGMLIDLVTSISSGFAL